LKSKALALVESKALVLEKSKALAYKLITYHKTKPSKPNQAV